PSQATGAPPHPLTTAVPTPPCRRISPTPELRQRHSLQKTEGRLQGPNHRGQATTSPIQSHLKQQAAGLHPREKERESHPPTVLSQSAESTTYSQRRGRPASGTRQAVAATAGPASPTPEEVKLIEREAAKQKYIFDPTRRRRRRGIEERRRRDAFEPTCRAEGEERRDCVKGEADGGWCGLGRWREFEKRETKRQLATWRGRISQYRDR
ncbi:immunoglobulin A1 protease autotransporter, partial [Striga asiatica]